MKGLNALERIKDNLAEFVSDDYHYEDYVNDINLIEKELKTIEIIKKYGLYEVNYILCVSYKTYCESRHNPIPKEEYDLVNEVLQ